MLFVKWFEKPFQRNPLLNKLEFLLCGSLLRDFFPFTFLSYAIDNDFVLGLLLVAVVGGWVSADALNFTSLSLGATQRKS